MAAPSRSWNIPATWTSDVFPMESFFFFVVVVVLTDISCFKALTPPRLLFVVVFFNMSFTLKLVFD